MQNRITESSGITLKCKDGQSKHINYQKLKSSPLIIASVDAAALQSPDIQ